MKIKKQYYTAREVADIMGVKKLDTIYKWIKKGALESVQMGGAKCVHRIPWHAIPSFARKKGKK